MDFHKQYFVPNNALIAIVGDVGAAEAMAGLEKHFGDWKPGEVPASADDRRRPMRRGA